MGIAAPTLDVDWRDSKDFATCSTDRRILICRLGENQPLKELLGHADEVNAVKWDPSGALSHSLHHVDFAGVKGHNGHLFAHRRFSTAEFMELPKGAFVG